MDNWNDWNKILFLTNGTDVNGIPLSSGMLAIDKILDHDQLQTMENVPLTDAVFHIHSSGGCAVITADLPQSSRPYVLRAEQILKTWLEDLNQPDGPDKSDKQQILTLTITPLLLQGTLYLIYNQIVFADMYESENGYRMILAFDNTQTSALQGDRKEFYAVLLEEEEELRRQEQELKDSIREAEEERKKRNNPVEQFIQESITTDSIAILEDDDPKPESEDKDRRFS